jgi:aspartyl-tRNA(Asn)/glutamyl-tRNA(Gln) amidotransferase subunit A
VIATSACELHRRFYAGTRDPEQVTTESLEHCRNDPYNAMITVNDRAIDSARCSGERYRQQKPRGIWDGIPYVAKDNIAAIGLPWTAGIEAYRHRTATVNATLIDRLEAEGAILTGKANLHEAALGTSTDNPWFGSCHHPLRRGYSPGGSSGGSAVAVAAGYVPLALGTDTMGSVRIPAAFCGVYGYKPSNGLVSGDGVTPLSTVLDTIGLIASCADDLQVYGASLINVTPVTEAMAPVSIGTVAESALYDCTDEVIHAYKRAVDLLRKAGASLAEVDWIDNSTVYRRAGLTLVVEEAYQAHKAAMADTPNGFSDELTGLLHFGRDMGTDKPANAQAKITQLKSQAQWPGVDVVLTPATPCATHAFTETPPVNLADFTAIANLTGAPATALPFSLCANDLPLGLQLIGKTDQDKELLSHTGYIDSLLRETNG